MAKETSLNLNKLIEDYLATFPKNIQVESVFLFGSYATGQIRDDSDVDLVVLSENFREMPFIKRLEFLSKMRKAPLTRQVAMDIFGYTPEEFKDLEKESSIMRQAKQEGRFIWQRNKTE